MVSQVGGHLCSCDFTCVAICTVEWNSFDSVFRSFETTANKFVGVVGVVHALETVPRILSCVDLSHKRIVEIAFSGPASRVSRAASWATFMTALTVLTSLTSLLSYKRAANWRVLQSLFRSTVVRFFAKADSAFLTLIDSMAQAVVIFKASFAYIAARLAILVDRVLHRLEHIA